jgi:hypothetical protein
MEDIHGLLGGSVFVWFRHDGDGYEFGLIWSVKEREVEVEIYKLQQTIMAGRRETRFGFGWRSHHETETT